MKEPISAEDYFESGKDKFANGDLDGAIADLDKAINLKPNYEEAYNNRGIVKRHKGDLEGAIADYTEAINLKPNYEEAYNNRGFAKRHKGDPEGAIADLDKAINLKPNYAEAYNNRGVAKRHKGDLEGAIADYTEAINLKPNYVRAYCNCGVAKRHKGDLEGAIADLDKAINLKPNYENAYNNRGAAKIYKGDLEGAIADLDKAINLKLNNEEAYINRGVAKIRKGDLEGAIADLDKAISLNPNDAVPYNNRGVAKIRKGDLEGAIADLDQANDANPNIAKHSPLLHLAQQTKKIFAGKDKKKRKMFYELFKNITNLQKKIARQNYKVQNPMHFTKLDTLCNLAQGGHFHLYNSSGMEDKNEGKIFFELLFEENTEENVKKVDEIQEAFSGEHSNHTFLGSFVIDSDEYDGDDRMWYTYGKDKEREGAGCAFVFEKGAFPSKLSLEGFMQALAGQSIRIEDVKTAYTSEISSSENYVKRDECFLYPVFYSDVNIDAEIKEALEVLGTSLDEIHREIKKFDKQQEMKYLVGGMLDLVRFLFKDKSYAYESERRLVIWRGEDSKVVKKNLKNGKLYIECPKLNLKRVILGPALENDKELKDWLLEQELFKGTEPEICIRKSGD